VPDTARGSVERFTVPAVSGPGWPGFVVGGVVLPESGFGAVGVVVGGGLDFEVSVCPLVPIVVRGAFG